jgi:hypothetical protein
MIFAVTGRDLTDAVNLANVAEDFELQLLNIVYDTVTYVFFYQVDGTFPMGDFYNAICAVSKGEDPGSIILKDRGILRSK